MINAIETRYRGRKFRSRLEARWAVFFDSLSIPWDYELEGFALQSGPYLPDFWLPRQECWVEIKGKHPSPLEIQKCCELRKMTGKPVFIFHSGIDYSPISETDAGTAIACFPARNSRPSSPHGRGYQWVRCDTCGKYEVTLHGNWNFMTCKDPDGDGCPESQERFREKSVDLAFERALSYRFEW